MPNIINPITDLLVAAAIAGAAIGLAVLVVYTVIHIYLWIRVIF